MDTRGGFGYRGPMVRLYQFAPAFGLPNPSPFCFKIDTYLRMIGEPFETKIGNPQKAPKKKLPFINDNGTVVSDSNHIIEHLVRTRGDKLDKDLTAEQKAHAHIVRRMMEEGLYFNMVYCRWVDDEGFAAGKGPLFAHMPGWMRAFVPNIARSMVRKQVHAQGTGRHSAAEVYAIARQDIAALAADMGDKPFFLGDSPTSIDATVYAFLALLLWAPTPSGIAGAVESHKNLAAYCERMKTRYYGS